MTDLIKRKAAMVGLECSSTCRQSRDDAWQYQAVYAREMTIWVSFGNKEESCGFDFHKRLLINIIESCERMVDVGAGTVLTLHGVPGWPLGCTGIMVPCHHTHTPATMGTFCQLWSDPPHDNTSQHCSQQSATVTISVWQPSRLIATVILNNFQ